MGPILASRTQREWFEKLLAAGALDGPDHLARHVALFREGFGGGVDLVIMLGRIGDGCAEDDAVQTGPQARGHAHGAGFAGRVKGVAGQ